MKRLMTTWFISAAVFYAACASERPERQDADLTGDTGPAEVERNADIIDRMGRPEITNFVMRLPDAKVGYNAADSFAMTEEELGAARALFAAGTAFWDGLDGEVHWADERLANHIAMLEQDYLIVDTSVACSVNDETYLDIESGRTSCGGRTPNADIIDATITWLIGGHESSVRFTDGIDSVPKPAGDKFPYLREANAPPPAPPGGAGGAGGMGGGDGASGY